VAGCQAGRLESDEERLRAAGQRGEPAKAIGDAGGSRAGIRTRRQVHDEQVDRPTGEERARDRQALVERVGGQDQEPVEAHAAGDGLDRVEASGEIEPGDDRAVDLGLRREPEGKRRLAGARLAAEGDTRAARQATGTEDRIESRKAGPDDPLRATAAGRFAREDELRFLVRERCGRQRSDDPRSCRTPACLEGRQSSRHIRGERRHRPTIEQMF
jgi:hypothetical protein